MSYRRISLLGASVSDLSSDRPLSNPADDLFDHSSFARSLANAIRRQTATDGIVLALFGPWGSGKSTVLAYVEHYLGESPEAERPVVVPFNPWWFSGQENLAKAFLSQLQAILPEKFAGFKAVADKIGEFSEAVGGIVDVVATATGHGWFGGIFRSGTKFVARKPKDVPALKTALSKLLREQRKRVLVVVDDIDRLTPEEVRQLFTVIKALADFPYVTYLLAFDRDVASAAISEQTGLPGERYLEKIIQVPFELPRVDRETLRRALFVRLDAVMVGTPEGRFDSSHWTNVFFDGLDPLFQVPRDIVRLTNSLSVTYPAVVGEVNPVDFIAVECLRVFLPGAYDAVRMTPEQFTGYHAVDDGRERNSAIAFHDAWLAKLPEALRESTKDLMQRLFPRLESVWSNMHYSADSALQWRRELRVCSPEVFPTYFRLSLPAGAVSRAEVDALLESVDDSEAFASALRQAAQQKRPNGISKVRDLLERFLDHIPCDLTADNAEPVIRALMMVGDELVIPTDIVPGEFDFGNEARVTRIAYQLLKKCDATRRVQLLTETFTAGNALRCGEFLFGSLYDRAEKARDGGREALLTMADCTELKEVWLRKIRQSSVAPGFIDHPSIDSLLSAWRQWGGDAETAAWWAQAAASDDGLLKLIASHMTTSTSNTFGEHALRFRIRVNPKKLAPYADVQAMATRISALLADGKVAEQWEPAARQFVRECDMLKKGKNPDAPFAFDD